MNRSVLVVLGTFVISLGSPAASRADFVYELTSKPETWTQAEAEAVAAGGHLASINSQAEETFLINTFVSSSTPGGPLQPFWIGLRDVNFSPNSSNRNFQWTDGQTLTYTDWNQSTGEPNNNGGNESYVAFNFHYAFGQGPQGTWNDTYQGAGPFGDREFYGIIELNSSPVPEPSSALLLGVGVLALAGYRWSRRLLRTPSAGLQ